MAEAIFERHQRLSDFRFDFFPAIPQPDTNPFPAQTPPQPSAFPCGVV